MANPHLVREAAGELVVGQALVAGDGTHVRPHVGDGFPGDGGAASVVGRADGLLERKALVHGADVHGLNFRVAA